MTWHRRAPAPRCLACRWYQWRGSASHALGRIFAQFQQYAAGRRGMHEDVEMAAGADFYLIADQPRAFLFELLDRSREIVDGNGNVVQPFAAFGNEASDGGIRRRGF